MSDDPDEVISWRATIEHPAMAPVLRITRAVVRGTFYFAFCFVEIIAELLAPIALICGVGWSFVPRLVTLFSPDAGQAHDMIAEIAAAVPTEIRVGGTYLTPGSLITLGLLMIAVVALCRTFQAMVVTE